MRVRERSIRRVLRKAALLAAAGGLVVLIALWLAFQRKPAWYRPAVLDEVGLQQARRDLTNLTDWIGDQLVRREPFDLVLKQQEVNAWLAALPHIWPEATRILEPAITHPAVAFTQDALYVGVELASQGWRVIANLQASLSVTPDGDGILIFLAPPYGGSLPIPRSLIDPPLTRLLQEARRESSSSGHSSDGIQSALRDVETVDELFQGIRTRNRFVWPNGRRPFRIKALDFTEGELKLQIEPL